MRLCMRIIDVLFQMFRMGQQIRSAVVLAVYRKVGVLATCRFVVAVTRRSLVYAPI